MSLKRKIAVLNAAEALCQQQRQEADRALAHLKSELRRTATPTRIVVSGLAVGFAAGLRKPSGGDGDKSGSLLSGPLFSMFVESVLPGLLAGVTAAVTGAMEGQDEEQDEAPDETSDDTHDEPEAGAVEDEPSPLPGPPTAEASPPPARRPRKKRNADSAA